MRDDDPYRVLMFDTYGKVVDRVTRTVSIVLF